MNSSDFLNYQRFIPGTFFEQLPEWLAHLVMTNWTVLGTRPVMLGVYVWSAPMMVTPLQRTASTYVSIHNVLLQIKTYFIKNHIIAPCSLPSCVSKHDYKLWLKKLAWTFKRLNFNLKKIFERSYMEAYQLSGY